jgi:hypothetical protein
VVKRARQTATNAWSKIRRRPIQAILALLVIAGGITTAVASTNHVASTGCGYGYSGYGYGGYTANGEFVCSVYDHLLNRFPESGGLTYWENQLSSGMSRSALAYDIATSSEYRGDLVNNYYETFLGRASDAGGQAYWVTQMNSGARDESVLANILGSSEFYTNSDSTSAGFVTALYTKLLGRSPESGGLTYWENQLSSGGSRSAVAYDIATSSEYRGDLVGNYYESFLGRASDPGGQAYWVAQLNGGTSNESVIAAIVGSSEFYTDSTA